MSEHFLFIHVELDVPIKNNDTQMEAGETSPSQKVRLIGSR